MGIGEQKSIGKYTEGSALEGDLVVVDGDGTAADLENGGSGEADKRDRHEEGNNEEILHHLDMKKWAVPKNELNDRDEKVQAQNNTALTGKGRRPLPEFLNRNTRLLTSTIIYFNHKSGNDVCREQRSPVVRDLVETGPREEYNKKRAQRSPKRSPPPIISRSFIYVLEMAARRVSGENVVQLEGQKRLRERILK